MSATTSTDLEKQSLEAHVDLCALRYDNLEKRLTKVEDTLEEMRDEMRAGNSSLIKVMIGAAGTIVAGLLSTIVVLLMNM
jgi:chromosome condensin MukBEF ATPase and DNA-binding subunit MukB